MTNTNTKFKNSKIQDLRKEYSTEEDNTALEILITARIGLLLRHPFFGNMATRLTLVNASTWCSTIATDGRNFFYNIGFVLKCSAKVAEFGFAHEVLHNIFNHSGRRGSRDPRKSNVAADYAVNQICRDEKIGQFPKFMEVYYDPKYRNLAFEEIYDMLGDEDMSNDFDEHIDDLTPDEKKQIADEIKEAIISAGQAAGSDKLPPSVRKLFFEFTEPQMDWRELLRMNIQSIIRSNYSFTRPNRKSQHSGAILPGLITAEAIDISIAVDMSGSITAKQCNIFLSEVKSIMDEYQEFRIDLWCFDDVVHNHKVFTNDNLDEITSYKVMGGGGTNFASNYDFMKQNDIIPKKFIMFTDGYAYGSWGDSDYCDTLFVIHGSTSIKSPFGQTAYFD